MLPLQDALTPAFFTSLLTSTWKGLEAAPDSAGKQAAAASFKVGLLSGGSTKLLGWQVLVGSSLSYTCKCRASRLMAQGNRQIPHVCIVLHIDGCMFLGEPKW